MLDKTLSCPWLRHRKWRENFTAAEFVPSHFPVPLPSCDVPNPGALTADSGPFPGALGKLWKGVGVISGVRVWERGGTAAEAESPLGSPRGCPSVHARHRAFMSPRAFSLSGATKQRWHVTPLPSPASDYGVDPAALFSFCVPAAPAFQGGVGGCQLGHGLQATGHVMLPRPLEGQAPPCPPQEMPGAAASVWGEQWPVAPPSRQCGERSLPPALHELTSSQAASPLVAFGTSTCCFGWNVRGGCSHRMFQRTQWTTLSGSTQLPP